MWYTLGVNSYGKPSCAGPFSSEDEARQCKEDIPQITEVIELPTRSLQKAKGMIRLRQARGDHDLDSGSMRIRGYNDI